MPYPIIHLTIQAVIFDMDGVITDTMPYHFRVWREIFLREGFRVSQEDIYKREGQKGIESVRELLEEYKRPWDEGYAHNLLKEKEERFKEVFRPRFIAGSRGFLKKLHKQNFKLALVTGSSRSEVLKLLPFDLFNLFTVTICANDVNYGKPHPEPYLTALQKLSIGPEDAIVIENAPFGIRSAKAAGLRCLAIETSLPKSYLHQADAVFSSFKELMLHASFQKNPSTL